MRIKLDENLPYRLVDVLTDLGHDVDTVPEEALSGCSDERVWDSAQKEKRFLITQDLDFSNIQLFVPGTHQGILLIRLHEPGRQALIDRIRSIFAAENTDHWIGCFVVATEHKIRIKRPE